LGFGCSLVGKRTEVDRDSFDLMREVNELVSGFGEVSGLGCDFPLRVDSLEVRFHGTYLAEGSKKTTLDKEILVEVNTSRIVLLRIEVAKDLRYHEVVVEIECRLHNHLFV
jgi:hypothetical protein